MSFDYLTEVNAAYEQYFKAPNASNLTKLGEIAYKAADTVYYRFAGKKGNDSDKGIVTCHAVLALLTRAKDTAKPKIERPAGFLATIAKFKYFDLLRAQKSTLESKA